MSFPRKTNKMLMSWIPRDWRHAMFGPGIVIPGHNEFTALKCPFSIDLQEKDSIPAEFTSGAQHYVSRQDIMGTVQAPITSYYATLWGAPIVIANYGGVWFKVELRHNKAVTVRPVQAILHIKHLPYTGINLQSLVNSGEPTPAELQQSRPLSRAATEIHSELEQDDGMREQSSTAKGKDPCQPRGTGDNPFGIWDLPQDTEKNMQGGQLEGNPLKKFYGDQSDTSNFLLWFKQFMSLNQTLAIAWDPIQKAMYFLSFMAETKMKEWTWMQSLWLQEAKEDPLIIPTMHNAWQMVEHDFKQTFVDYTIKEKA
jgi:hypothetical protein